MSRAHDLADKQDLIPGIFNYCDRWCERCAFTSRCRVFASERARAVEESADPIADAIEVVKDSFAEAKQMLIAHAEEMGIDLEAAMNDPEIDASLERQRATVEEDEAFKLASAYATDSRQIFERAADWLPSDHDPMIGEMVEILQWYQFLSQQRYIAVCTVFSTWMDITTTNNSPIHRATPTARSRSRSLRSNGHCSRGPIS